MSYAPIVCLSTSRTIKSCEIFVSAAIVHLKASVIKLTEKHSRFKSGSEAMSDTDFGGFAVGNPVPSSTCNTNSSNSDQAQSKRRSTFGQVRDGVARTSALLHEWTPFLLVTMYIVGSFCMYCLCGDSLVAIFWFIYLTSNFYIAGSTVVEAFISLTPIREARRAVMKAERKKWVFPTRDEKLPVIDLIIVAYLPNEKDIIMDRALYLLEKIMYPPEKIRMNVVYNTPRPIEPLETDLVALMARFLNLRVIKVPGSTSKADNLNYFFSFDTGADVIAIYDCDHYPHPYAPRWAAERLVSNKKIDVVQGRCVIFNAHESWLSAMIAVEFDKIYAVSHPGRAAMWGFGLFTGSNGYWRASLIKEMKMDASMLTEDIDSALRAVARNAKTVHDSNVISYELAPVAWKAFWKQRLRWTQGWTQASIRCNLSCATI